MGELNLTLLFSVDLGAAKIVEQSAELFFISEWSWNEVGSGCKCVV